MSKTVITPISRKSNLVTQEIGDEILIYDLNENKAFNLNQTSALIWQLCDGNRTISQITQSLSEKLNSPVNEDLVQLGLEKLKKLNLLANSDQIQIDFNGLSRREVIRKVGLSTLAVLPIVSTLIVPLPVNAQSGVCASGTCRCPNSSANCNGSAVTVGGTTYVNCRTGSNNNPNCNCVGPFGNSNSAGTDYKVGKGCFII